jgi:hypothetical protein
MSHGAMPTNRRLLDLEGPDFYPTPAWGTLALMNHVTFKDHIVEPCCGDGAMSEVLATRYKVFSSDLHQRGYGTQKDFFDIKHRIPNLVTNPPFNIAEDMLTHALTIVDRKICLLLRLAFLESVSRYKKFYSITPPSEVLVFTERLSMYPKGYTVKSGGTTSYGWFIWELDKPPTQTKIAWVPPGAKHAKPSTTIE